MRGADFNSRKKGACGILKLSLIRGGEGGLTRLKV